MLGVRRIGRRWGVTLNRIEGQTFAGTLRDPNYMRDFVCLQVAIHRHRAAELPDLKDWLGAEIQKAGIKLGASLPLQGILDRLAEMPESDRLCHGDFSRRTSWGSPGTLG
jgi:hypothetical protein